jgi:hypothetical protein
MESPSWHQCLEAAGKVGLDVLAVASDGTSAEAELAMAIEALAEDEGSSAVEDGAACLVGGSSFTAGTRVLLADGKATSYDGWRADFYMVGSRTADIKIRLGGG